MNRSPKGIGEVSEAQVIARMLLAGEVVLQPFGDNQRYDIVLDRDGTFLRVQIKTGRIRKGAVIFNTCSNGPDHKTTVGYIGDADLFAVYCPENNKVYVIPVEECGKVLFAMRVEPAKNRQDARYRSATDYEYPMATTQPVKGLV